MLTNIVSQHLPIYLQQFPSYSNRKCKKSPFSRTTAHIFVSPADATATMTQNVASMERQFNAAKRLAACTYLSLIVSELYVMRKPQNRHFLLHFCFPCPPPSGANTLTVAWIERQFDAYKLPRCMCPSNYNRF